MSNPSDVQKIEIFLSGRSLKDKDLFSKSDPYVQFLTRGPQGQQWISCGRTETIRDNLNPNFSKSFIADFLFETKQDCRFEVYDDDGSSSDFIGYAETTIGNLMGACKQTSILDLHVTNSKKSQGKLIIRCDNVKESNEWLFMKWHGVKLMNTDGWFGTSDPLLRFYKIREDRTIQKVHETEVVMNNLNPVWVPFEISAGKLCQGADNQAFKVECLDWEKDGKYQFIGEATMTVAQLKSGKKDFQLTNPQKKDPGLLRLDQFQIIVKPNFLDYIRGGLQLNLILAVDFTGSNGSPSSPQSLHYMTQNQMNQYQQAIISVGEILLAYDYDQMVPCYGFGAKTRFPNLQSNTALHCFPLSGDGQNVEANGISQILDQYKYALQHVELAGPTYFAPILQQSLNVASALKTQEQNVYTILLILTDGEIHDMGPSVDHIVQASHLPLSVIIVGVGNADFNNMEILDGDDGLTNAKGVKAKRDLVQFVPYRNFKGNPVLLAKHVLAEIPDQVTKYHQLIGKKPQPYNSSIQRPVISNIQNMGYSTMPPNQQQTSNQNTNQPHVQSPPYQRQPSNQQLVQNPYQDLDAQNQFQKSQYGQAAKIQASQRPTTAQAYNQNPNGQPNYNPPNNQPTYNQPNNQPNNQPAYNQPNNQPAYNQPNNQPAYNPPNQQGGYNQPNNQPAYNPPNNKSIYNPPNGYNPPQNIYQSQQSYNNGQNQQQGQTQQQNFGNPMNQSINTGAPQQQQPGYGYQQPPNKGYGYPPN